MKDQNPKPSTDNSDSKEKKDKAYNGFLSKFLFSLSIITINVFVTNYIVSVNQEELFRQLPSALDEVRPIPKIITVDMEFLVQSLIDEGNEPTEVLRYTKTLTSLLLFEGYLILDERQLISPSPKYSMKPIDKEVLYENAKKVGINISKEDFEAAFNQSQQNISDLLPNQ